MKQSRIEDFPYLKPSVNANPHLHTASLLSPADVEVALKGHPDDAPARLRALWMLVGAVNRGMYARLVAYGDGPISARLIVFPTASGAAYLVMCCQIASNQHRFLLPLYSAEVVNFLRAATNKPLSINLECAGEPSGSMLYNCSLQPEQYIPAQLAARLIDGSRRSSFLMELPSIITAAMTPDLVPTMNGEVVDDVDVSVLLPLEAKQLTGDEGRNSVERSPHRH